MTTQKMGYGHDAKDLLQFLGSTTLCMVAMMAIGIAATALVATILQFVGVGVFFAWLSGVFFGPLLSAPIWMSAFLYIHDKTSP